VRAHRRWLELAAAGERVTEAEVLAQLQERDRRDSERATAPLRPAPDALLLDTTELSIDAAVEKAVKAIDARIRQGRA
jgi:cytidylate kinase